jgi:hypothetical protein
MGAIIQYVTVLLSSFKIPSAVHPPIFAYALDSINKKRIRFSSFGRYINKMTTDKLLRFRYDDQGVRCWEFKCAGWISERDRLTTDPHIRKMIEAHPEFQGWVDESDDESEEY